jgi:hypothetical protein
MEFLNVIAAAVAAYAFAAVWYIAMARPWAAAAQVPTDATGRVQGGSPMPFIIALVAMVLVAGMMRHILASAGIATVGGGAVSGAGIGAFVITPWVAMNYGFAMRPAALTLIDGVNAIVGCTIMGAVLMLF